MNTTEISAVPYEHERRFFPNLKTFSFDPLIYTEVYIVQGYLEDELKTRIRDETYANGAHKYLQTRKSGEGVSRQEDGIELAPELFEELWDQVEVYLVKSRYFVPLPGGEVVAQVNVFHGALNGYIQIEVEFSSHEEAVAFIPPDWFGIEVTDDVRHGNYYLAKHGCQGLLV
jgi:CYTH domain-containing protein